MYPKESSFSNAIETTLGQQGFHKIAEHQRMGNSIADLILHHDGNGEVLVLFARSRASSPIASSLQELRMTGLSVGMALLEPHRIQESLVERFRRQQIGLLQVRPPKAEWLVPFSREKATPSVEEFKRRILQKSMITKADGVKNWFKEGPICPEHKIPAKRAIFKEQGIEIRGWRCREGDFEILHPLDAELSLYMSKFGPMKARVGIVGGQFVIRLPKLVVAKYGLKDGQELEIDLRDLHHLKLETQPIGGASDLRSSRGK